MSNISKDRKLTDDLTRLDRARKLVDTSKIYQDLNDDGLFICQSSRDPKMFYIENFLDNGLLSCSCPDCKYRAKECKHISEIKIKLFAKTEFNKIDVKKLLRSTSADQYETIILDLDKGDLV
jgi:hypothetical protein